MHFQSCDELLTLSFYLWYFFFEYHPIQLLEKIENSKHGQADFLNGQAGFLG
jgi:hypothetical protein